MSLRINAASGLSAERCGVAPSDNNAGVKYDSKITSQIPPEVAERLGPYFVYALVDPRDKQIFYIGKGKGVRPAEHGVEAMLVADKARSTQSAKQAKINSIRAVDQEPEIEIMRHGLREDEALSVEAALIDCLGLDNLTNAVQGHRAERGRSPLKELKHEYGATDIDQDAPPALVIILGSWVEEPDDPVRKAAGYKPEATYQQIVDATRAWWKIDPKRVKARGIEIAVATHKGVSRAVMEIGEWQQRSDGRWAFEATPITDGPIFDKWVGPLGKRIPYRRGVQSPVLYWPFKGNRGHGMHGTRQSETVKNETVKNETQTSGTEQGRPLSQELKYEYGATDIERDAPPALVIRLADWVEEPDDPVRKAAGYKREATYQQIVDATRAWWRIRPERVEAEGIKYAVAVHKGVSRAVMEIGEWQQRGDGRWAFEATPITDGEIFDKWVGPLGKRIRFKKGAQSPVLYWPFKESR